jgi:hypothetical protein
VGTILGLVGNDGFTMLMGEIARRVMHDLPIKVIPPKTKGWSWSIREQGMDNTP